MIVFADIDRNFAILIVILLLGWVHFKIRNIRHQEEEEEQQRLSRENRMKCGACRQRISVQNGVFVEHLDRGMICGGSLQPPATLKKYLPPR